MSQNTTATADAPQHEGALARLARACARHGWRTIAIWVVVAVAIVGGSATFGGTLVDEFTIPDSDAQRATDLLEQRFPQQSGESAQLVFAVPEGQTLAEGQAPAAIRDALAAAAAVPGVEDVGNPLTEDAAGVSDDGRIAYVDVQFSGAVLRRADRGRGPAQGDHRGGRRRLGRQELEFTGPVIQNSEPPETGTSELLGLIAAIIILLIMLGSASPPACRSCSRWCRSGSGCRC